MRPERLSCSEATRAFVRGVFRHPAPVGWDLRRCDAPGCGAVGDDVDVGGLCARHREMDGWGG